MLRNSSAIITLLFFGVLFQYAEGLRILGVFTYFGKSHFVMCEQLMRGLAVRGHQVDVYSNFPLKNPPPNYTDYSLLDGKRLYVNNVTYESINLFSTKNVIHVIAEPIGKPACDMLHGPVFQKLINNPPTDPPYDVLIIANFMAPCFLPLGRHLNIPIVNVITSLLYDFLYKPMGNPIFIAAEPSPFTQSARLETFFDRLSNWALFHYTDWSYNYYTRFQNEIVNKVFGPGYPSIADLHRDISLVLVNHNQALNGIRAFTPAVVPVGGLHVVDTDDELQPRVQRFLDESKDGFIYVSFGSMVRIETFPKADIKVFYKTFEKIAPVRVLMKIAKPEELPAGLPSNVLTESWLPQIKVLKHKNIKAFVTHGGLMGTQEAVYYAVPMIGFPLFADQYLNIESYAKKNLAIQLDRYNITEQTFTEAVFEILNNPVYKKSIELVSKAFKDVPMSPMDTAAFWIEYVVRNGKNALRSPVVDLPWWQVNLLDIYGFIASFLVVVFFFMKFLLKKFIRFFLSKVYEFSKIKIKQC